MPFLKIGFSEFGSKTSSGWVWNIVLRRNLFSWEVKLMEGFLKVLDKAPKSVFDAIRTSLVTSDKTWKLVWKNFAPPKVEAFLWKMVHCRVSTHTELGKCGVNSVNSLLCVLCGKEPETHIRPPRGSWVAPPYGSCKFNVDVSVMGSFGEASIGGILRDHNVSHSLIIETGSLLALNWINKLNQVP
ncbi:hypothetical protein GQ457_17G003240 [Hibiscus cannabinus]